MQLTRHCVRHPELSARALMLWEPDRGGYSPGGKRDTYIDNLKRDAGLPKIKETTKDLLNLMKDRKVWGRRIRDSRVGVT